MRGNIAELKKNILYSKVHQQVGNYWKSSRMLILKTGYNHGKITKRQWVDCRRELRVSSLEADRLFCEEFLSALYADRYPPAEVEELLHFFKDLED